MKKKKTLNSFQLKQRNNQLKINELNPTQQRVVTFEDCNKSEDIIIKLYKDCNENKKKFMKKNSQTQNTITKHHLDVNPPKSKDNIEITSYTTLPINKIKEINRLVYENNIMSNRCWFVSNHLSLNIEDIDVVDGWYGFDMTSKVDFGDYINDDFENDFIELLTNHSEDVLGFSLVPEKRIGDFVQFDYLTKHQNDDFNGQVKKGDKFWGWLNVKTGYYYLRHSYNRYKNIYFDISSEMYEGFSQYDMIFNVIEETSYTNTKKINSELGGWLDGMCLSEITDTKKYMNRLRPIDVNYKKKISSYFKSI